MDNRLEIILAAKDVTGKAFATAKQKARALTESVFSLNTAIGGLIGVAGVGGMGMLAKQTLESSVELKRNADMAGVTVTAFQELTYVTNQYAITQDALTDGLKELNLRAEEFIFTGSGPGKEAFERLGYSQGELNNKLKDTPALLADIIDRMQGMESASKMRIADEIFGGQGGEQFVSMINGGADAIETFTQKAHEMGVVLDQETVANSIAANKAINALTKQLQTQFTKVVAELAPDLGKMATNMGHWVTANQTFISQDIPGHIKKMGTEVKTFVGSKEFTLMKEYWEIAAGAAIGMKIGNRGGFKGMALGALLGAGAGGYYSAYKDLVELTKDQRTELKKLQDEYDGLSHKIKETETLGTRQMKLSIPFWKERQAEIKKQTAKLIESAAAQKKQTKEIEETAKATEKLSEKNQGLSNTFDDLTSYISNSVIAMRDAGTAIEKIEDAQLKSNKISPYMAWREIDKKTMVKDVGAFYAAWVEEHNQALEDQKDALEKSLEEQQAAYYDFSDTVQDFTADILYDWENAWETMADIAKRTVSEMAAELLATKIVVPMAIQAGSSMGLSWQGTSFADMPGGNAGGGFGIMDGLSAGKSLWGAYSGSATTGTYNALTTGVLGDIGQGVFGASWTGGIGTLGAELGLGVGPTSAIGGGFSGMASGLAAAAPYLGLAAVAVPFLMKALGHKSDPPMLGIESLSAAQEHGGFATSSLFDFKTDIGDTGSQEAKDALNETLIGYFDTIFTDLNGYLNGNIQEILKSTDFEATLFLKDRSFGEKEMQQAITDLTNDIFGDLLDPLIDNILPDLGERFTKIKDLQEWVTVYTDVERDGPRIDRERLLKNSGETAIISIFDEGFFKEITLESETLFDTFNRFAGVMKETVDPTEQFIRQMDEFDVTLVDAFRNLETISSIMAGVDNQFEALSSTQLITVLEQTVISWDGVVDSLVNSHARINEIEIAKQAKFLDLGIGLTGMTATSLQNILSAGTASGDTGDSIRNFVNQSLIQAMSANTSEQIFKEYLSGFNTAIGEAFQTGGIGYVIEELPIITNAIDWTGLDTELNNLNSSVADLTGSMGNISSVFSVQADSMRSIQARLAGATLSSPLANDYQYQQLKNKYTGYELTEDQVKQSVTNIMNQDPKNNSLDATMARLSDELGETISLSSYTQDMLSLLTYYEQQSQPVQTEFIDTFSEAIDVTDTLINQFGYLSDSIADYRDRLLGTDTFRGPTYQYSASREMIVNAEKGLLSTDESEIQKALEDLTTVSDMFLNASKAVNIGSSYQSDFGYVLGLLNLAEDLAAGRSGASFSGGGSISGPESGYTLPVTFHGRETIVTESQIETLVSVMVKVSDSLEIANVKLNTQNKTSNWIKRKIKRMTPADVLQVNQV